MEAAYLLAMLEGACGSQNTDSHPSIEIVSAVVVESLKCCVFD